MPTELTVPMSAVSTPRARGGLCLKGRNLSWVGGGRVAVAWANGRASLDFAFFAASATGFRTFSLLLGCGAKAAEREQAVEEEEGPEA